MSEIIATEGRGINTQARGLDHQIIAQLLIPAKARRRQLLVPMVTSTGENQRINFYSLISAFLPNPQSRTPARRAQTTWVMANMDNGWSADVSPNWDQNNPVRNSNNKMIKLLYTEAPFNSMVVTGNISEEYVPANYEVDLTQINDAAKALYAAVTTTEAAKTPAAKSKAKAAIKGAYEAYAKIKQDMVSSFQLVKSNILFAANNGIVLTNSIVQGMNIAGSTTLNGENLWNNDKDKLTFAPYVLSFTGSVVTTQEQFDAKHPVYAYGVQQTQGEREFCRKGATLASAGREVPVRVEIYDNNMSTRSRAEAFDRATKQNAEIVVLRGRVSLHSYAEANGAANVILASKFHIEVESYATMNASGGNAGTVVDLSGFEDFASAGVEFEEIDMVEPVVETKVTAPAAAEQATEEAEAMPWE